MVYLTLHENPNLHSGVMQAALSPLMPFVVFNYNILKNELNQKATQFLTSNLALVVHSKALTSHMGLLDRNRKGSKPMEICTAFPESGAGLSKSIYALKHTKLMFVYRSPIFQY